MKKNHVRQLADSLLDNLSILAAGGAFLVLNIPFVKNPLLWVAGYGLLIVLCLCRRYGVGYVKAQANRPLLAVAVAAALYCAGFFARYMPKSGKLQALTGRIGLPAEAIVWPAALLGGAAAVYFLLFLLGWLSDKVRMPEMPAAGPQRPGRLTRREQLVCFSTAAVALTLLSRSSPLYPFNDWVDANCFFTVGKSMLSGMVPYRDLYEQKGPLLYMLHALTAAISYRTYLGVWLLEIVAAWGFLAMCRKITLLYRPKASMLWIPVTAALVYGAKAFCQGDSVEELSLPLLAWCLYCGLKSLGLGEKISFREGFLIGITSGAVLWMKYTLLGFYIGWFAAYAILRLLEKRLREVLETVAAIALGVAVITVPVFLYFLWNGALTDLWTAYFYNNIFVYSETDLLMSKMLQGNNSFGANNAATRILWMAALLGLLNSRRYKELLLTALSAGACFLFVYVGGSYHAYYCLIFSVFVPVGLIALMERGAMLAALLAEKLGKKAAVAAALTGCLACACVTSDNVGFLAVKQEELPQFQFAEIMNQYENPTLLNYGFLDGGFYTVAGIDPNCRYFCRLNIPLEELRQEQARYVEEGLVDFVVASTDQLNAPRYAIVAQATTVYEKQEVTYYLYQKK